MDLGRNDPCHCGSGNKYKKCCAGKDAAARSAELAAEQAARVAAAAAAAAEEAEAEAADKPAGAARGANKPPVADSTSKPRPKGPPPKSPAIRRRAV